MRLRGDDKWPHTRRNKNIRGNMKTTAEYKRDERKRKKESGLVRLELWTKPELAEQVKSYNQQLVGYVKQQNQCNIKSD